MCLIQGYKISKRQLFCSETLQQHFLGSSQQQITAIPDLPLCSFQAAWKANGLSKEKRGPQLHLWYWSLYLLGFSYSSSPVLGKQFWFWSKMTEVFAFLLITTFSLKPSLGASDAFICSPLPRAGLGASARCVCTRVMGWAARAETLAKLQSVHLARLGKGLLTNWKMFKERWKNSQGLKSCSPVREEPKISVSVNGKPSNCHWG